MPLPDFTPDEQYLINGVKSTAASRRFDSSAWGYLAGALIVAGFGAYHESVSMLLCAFAVLCGFRIGEAWQQSKWTPVWLSILQKYEAAASAGDAVPDGDLT